MSPFTAYRLRFTLEIVQPLTLPEPRGAALRGALLESLWRQHGVTALGTVAEPDGQLPRPYTIEPPLTASGQYAAGQQLTFSLTLFAAAHDLVPPLIGQSGSGRPSASAPGSPVMPGKPGIAGNAAGCGYCA